MKHYIFTRWNLLDRETDIYNNPKIKNPEKWMAHRIKLFEKYTLPSLKKQTNQNFTWLLAFSEQTPSEIICRYDYIDNIQIIYEYPTDWLNANLPNSEYVITSRIDNDDYYYEDFVKEVQNEASASLFLWKKPDFELVIDVEGVQFDEKTGKFYDNARVSNNSPFISFVEPVRKELKTVYYCSHTNMEGNFLSTKIKKRLSCMVIHDKNICNKIVGSEL